MDKSKLSTYGTFDAWIEIYRETGDPFVATENSGFSNSVTEEAEERYTSNLGHGESPQEVTNKELLHPGKNTYKPPEPGFLKIKKAPKKPNPPPKPPKEDLLLNLVPKQFKELAAELKKLINEGGDISNFPWWKFLPNPGAADKIVEDLLAGRNPKKGIYSVSTTKKKGKKRVSAKKGLTKKIQKRHKTCKSRVKDLQAEIKQLEKDLKELKGGRKTRKSRKT
jgi:chaperonin cofactor prefoldin